eukprot:5596528-Pyramimonas_sp.AAC.1
MTAKYISRARPALVVLENLTALLNEAGDGNCADAVAICEFLRGLGYSARAPPSAGSSEEAETEEGEGGSRGGGVGEMRRRGDRRTSRIQLGCALRPSM